VQSPKRSPNRRPAALIKIKGEKIRRARPSILVRQRDVNERSRPRREGDLAQGEKNSRRREEYEKGTSRREEGRESKRKGRGENAGGQGLSALGEASTVGDTEAQVLCPKSVDPWGMVSWGGSIRCEEKS
jgi:hypothetical protein